MELFDPDRLRIGEDANPDVDPLAEAVRWMRAESERMVGFPVNLDFDCRPLAEFLAVHGNNVGNPRAESAYRIDTKPFEVAVLDFFTALAGGDPSRVFGYLTSGGTESNTFAVWVARERHPDAVLYASAEAHYSLPKLARLLRMPHVAVRTRPDGTLDTTALVGELARHPGRAAVVAVTIGTTGRGAVDDLPGVRRALAAAGVERSWVHCDAAFGGILAEFGDEAIPWNLASGADSVAMSGHKVIGCPVPCGVVLVPEADVATIRAEGVAVGSDDDTITGSRDALAPVLLWHELRRLGRRGVADLARRCHRTAAHAQRGLAEVGRNPSRARGGTIVLFDRPPADFCRRWHLVHDEEHAALVVMPHVTEQQVDELCAELADLG
ncbi:Siderophore biosynthesis L-2,4-diaminobutyrate decarboxylase [Actinokineospora spheciospongiae]|uniref:Siderophore biosynthesis L-2,4-diaminobutyrate decarboxylase n=1 Tax=Actinokineospora spheciospongiae TaxID=909613 RepID=W7J5B7_9PSEU|nr:histidine decarboxylase [Actinokineospora spheciospongiae]EWC64176.1 Siderophore biosynthesis L-2,4-diaminobutyrate decarboxylase [Actinokineospora spheciospongiae]PWW62800.1 L-histidine carboxy-lyase (histamine-forming) [Actinokineospora spheciospongiae]